MPIPTLQKWKSCQHTCPKERWGNVMLVEMGAAEKHHFYLLLCLRLSLFILGGSFISSLCRSTDADLHMLETCIRRVWMDMIFHEATSHHKSKQPEENVRGGWEWGYNPTRHQMFCMHKLLCSITGGWGKQVEVKSQFDPHLMASASQCRQKWPK